jgi:hypothetical protein
MDRVLIDEPIISAEDCVELSLQLDDEDRLELLRAWFEGNWRKVRKFIDAWR